MNDQHRRNEELAKAKRQFQQAVARGQVGAKDRFGNPIEAGDKLMLRTDIDLIFDVVSVNPLLDPNAPPGIMSVVLTVTFPMQIQAGVPYPKAHVIAKREPVQIPVGSDNGNEAARPSLVVVPREGEAAELADVQAEGEAGDRPDTEDDEPGT